MCAIGIVDVRNDIVDEILAELRGVVGLQPTRGYAVAERHDDDERLDGAGGEQVVENQVRPAQSIPRVLVGVGAVEQIQHRVSRRLVLVVTRRRVDREPPHGAERFRLIPVRADLPVRYRLRVVEGRRRMLDFEHARNRAGRRAGLQLWIGGIDRSHAVDREVVVVNLGRNRADRHAPDAVRIFREASWAVEKLAREDHLISLRRVQAKRHAAVRQNVWRDEWLRLLRVAERCRRDEENGNRELFCRHFGILYRYAVTAVYFSCSRSTAMWRHCPWLNRRTLRTQRVAWPIRMAIQMSIGSSVAVR